MLTKILGMVFIVGSTTVVGFYFSKLDIYRFQDLTVVKKALTMLFSEIKYSSSSLPLALESISNRLDHLFGDFLNEVSNKLKERTGKNLFEIWKVCLNKYFNRMYLNKEDYENLISFGKTLGYLDKEMQQKNIELIILYIDEQIKDINSKKNINSKLYKSLGFLIGMVLTIILL